MDSAARYDEVAREIRAPGRRAPGSALDGRELVRLATLAASSHNTQPWTFRLEGASVAILHLEPSDAVRPGELYQAIPWRQCTKTAYDGTPLESHDITLLEGAGRGPVPASGAGLPARTGGRERRAPGATGRAPLAPFSLRRPVEDVMITA